MAEGDRISNANMDVSWDGKSRVAFVRYLVDAKLSGADADLVIGALTRWVGTEWAPFAVIADAKELKGTDSAYRSRMSTFLKAHRNNFFITLINVGPVIHIFVEMFRVGTGIQLKTFPTEEAARAWLRGKGIAA